MRKNSVIKNGKKCILIIVAIFLIGVGYYILQPDNVDTEKTYKLGKTPHSYQYTFGKNVLLYKDNVVKNEESEFSGLYYNSNFAHKDSILLKNIQGFGLYRIIYEAIQLPVRTLSLSVNRSGTKFAEKTSAH